jgi:anti-sigma B factor antagonist
VADPQESGIEPAPRRDGPGWAEFLRTQAQGILALDFFTADLLNGAKVYVLAVALNRALPQGRSFSGTLQVIPLAGPPAPDHDAGPVPVTPRGQEERLMRAAGAGRRLHLEYRLDSGVAVVTVTGEVDISTCHALREGLLRVITDERHCGLVVNLADVQFIDSTGIGVLVGVWHQARATNGSLALAALSPRARGVLDTTGLAKAFWIYDTEAEAVEACRPPAAW